MHEIVPAKNDLLDLIAGNWRVVPTERGAFFQIAAIVIKPRLFRLFRAVADHFRLDKFSQKVLHRLRHQAQAALSEHLKALSGFLPFLKLVFRLLVTRFILRHVLAQEGLKWRSRRKVERPDEIKLAIQG